VKIKHIIEAGRVLGFLLLFFQNFEGFTAEANALMLDGVDDYASAPDSPSLELGGGNFTIEGFFVSPITNKLGYAVLVSKDKAYEVGLEISTNGVTILHFTLWKTPDDSGKIDCLGVAGALIPGRHHFAVAFDNSVSTTPRSLFLDGLPVGYYSFVDFPSGIANSTSPIKVGGGSRGYYFGWLNELRISKVVRYTNGAQIDQAYRVPAMPFAFDTNTVALWHFDEPPGATNFSDASGNGNTLSAVNGSVATLTPVFQSPGLLDQTFYSGLGEQSDFRPSGIYALGIQTNGQVIVGGQFSRIDGLLLTNLARLNPDGSVDQAFNVVLSNLFETGVNAVLVLTNNQILIGGEFSAVNGFQIDGLARLNPEGSLDTSFSAALVGQDSVTAIIQQPDGKLVIFGSFFSVHGVHRVGAARLNSNGTLDSSFDAGAFGQNLSKVKHAAIQPDGKLLCVVSIFGPSSQTSTNLVRLNANGSFDNSFQPAITDQSLLTSLALQPDGRIVLCGYFTNINGIQCNGAARLLTNGMLDATFNISSGGLFSFAASQKDGKLLIADGAQLQRLRSDGSLDPSFQSSQFSRPVYTTHTIYASLFLASGTVLISGDFLDLNGYNRGGIARLYGEAAFPPHILSITPLLAGVIRLDVTNPASLPMVLQTTTNLGSASWQTVATNSVTTNQCQFLQTNTPPSTTRFYRTMLLGP